MPSKAFLDALAARLSLLAAAPHLPQHPRAVSFALGLRQTPETIKAQKGYPLPLLNAATTDKLPAARLTNTVSASHDHPSDKLWKAGYSASVAYGPLLKDTFGADAQAAAARFEAEGLAVLAAQSGLPKWLDAFYILPGIGRRPDNGKPYPKAEVKANFARFILGASDGKAKEVSRGAYLVPLMKGPSMQIKTAALPIVKSRFAAMPVSSATARALQGSASISGVSEVGLWMGAGILALGAVYYVGKRKRRVS